MRFGRNTIKKIQYSSVTHCDALPEDYKIIRAKDELFSHYKHKTNGFQLNIMPLSRQLPYKVCTVCYIILIIMCCQCLKCAHNQLCSEKLGKPGPTVSHFPFVRMFICPSIISLTCHVYSHAGAGDGRQTDQAQKHRKNHNLC